MGRKEEKNAMFSELSFSQDPIMGQQQDPYGGYQVNLQHLLNEKLAEAQRWKVCTTAYFALQSRPTTEK